MSISINVYARQAITYLATYGTAGLQGDDKLFGILCSTDSALYDASFTGRVDQLLSSGVAELPTGNGYIKYGQKLFNYYTAQYIIRTVSSTVNLSNYSSFSTATSPAVVTQFRPSTRAFPQVLTGPSSWTILAQYAQSFTWTVPANGQGLSAKSLLLCYQTPLSPASTDAIYSSSYPLAMIDFGGTVTAGPGQALPVPYPPVADVIRWTVD